MHYETHRDDFNYGFSQEYEGKYLIQDVQNIVVACKGISI